MPDRVPGIADVIFTNGRILTFDAGHAVARGIAVGGERILAVGSEDAVAAHAGPRTRRIDLDDRTVIPGIVDAHAHMEREGLKRIRPSLDGAKTVAAVLDRIAAESRRRPAGEWIVTMPVGEPPFYFGGPGALAERRMPSLAELDAAAPDHPVCIMAGFGHWGEPPCYWALNSRALHLAGIGPGTVSVFKDVEIMHDPATGAPTGVVVEHARRPLAQFDVLRKVPRFTFAERLAGLAESMRLYNGVGTTSIYEGHGSAPETIAAYRQLWERGEMSVRAHLTVSPTWRDVTEAGRMMRDSLAYARGRGLGDSWLRISGVFVGLLGDKAVRESAIDALPDTGWSGFVEPASSLDEFCDLAHLCAECDLRLHTIVSRRMGDVLPVLEAVNARFPLARRRWVVEHIDSVSPEQIAALQRLGILATAIPATTLWKNGRRLLDQPDDGGQVLPLRSLLEAGVPVAAGTDNIPINPFHTLWAMMARIERTTGRPIGPAQRLTAEQGLRTLTREGAWLSFEESEKGTLSPGRLADLAVLTADPDSVSLNEIADITSCLTMVGGRIVHEEPWS